ncbi:phosphatidic acid phosphatase type 2/haloperoxidase [Fimicolochytrium jonesii]|uniref:phosphatidic acid phosphatase type 2/haloperoxidase n=1 Tax=Fimicolochytrium jonesii TaxID=1396493 RepID=UPI0022FEFDD6|nr:phosphatidic acid phosphatase type 2/haloperoxidase [Fimicolochytrium jonesii]KAI8824203.1 phosphatidic acid phosphatase type 2/haloperoxidase [Fimicolochytrium jonesii]
MPESDAGSRVHVLYESRSNSLKHLLRESLWEWVVLILLLGVSGALEFITPYQRVAFAGDISIAYPLKTQTVPTWLLAVLAIVLPLVVILVTSLVIKRSVFDAHMSALGLCVSLIFTLIFTQIVKISVGSLRPDFLARCIPTWQTDELLKVTTVASCSGFAGDIKEGRKSFFSGHSSLSWSGLFFLSIYLLRRLNIHRKPLAPKYAVAIIPIILALLISISRVDDYWHRWEDVVIGAIVGIVISTYSYRYHCWLAEELVSDAPGSATNLLPNRRDGSHDTSVDQFRAHSGTYAYRQGDDVRIHVPDRENSSRNNSNLGDRNFQQGSHQPRS